MPFDKHFQVGKFIKAKGLKGELQLYAGIDGFEGIKFNTLFVDMAGKLVPYFVSAINHRPNGVFFILEDVDTVEKATRLLKRDVYLPEKLRPKKKKGEFTLSDLKGFSAIDENEGELGEILEVQEIPQQYIATVHYKNCEVLFPLNEETVKSIDVVKGIVLVDLPDGLLDIYLE